MRVLFILSAAHLHTLSRRKLTTPFFWRRQTGRLASCTGHISETLTLKDFQISNALQRMRLPWRMAAHGTDRLNDLAVLPSQEGNATTYYSSWASKYLVMVFADPFKDERIHAKTTMNTSVFKHYTSPFPPLRLTSGATTELAALARKFVARSINTYEHFMVDDRGKVDERRWKFLSAKDDLRAYGERLNAVGVTATYESDTPAGELPIVLVTGTIVGNLDDIMFGVLCNSTEAMRIKTSYIQDLLTGCCVLAPVVSPTPENPFNAVDVKWNEVQVPWLARPIMQNRDYVYLETTGIERLRSGERVGYHYCHSIQFPETPFRESFTRGNMSIGILYRQRDKNVTDVFIKGFFNPEGGIERSIVLKVSAKVLLSVAKNVYCCKMKKLVWALHLKYSSASSSSCSDSSNTSTGTTPEDKKCSGCGKKQSVFVTAASKTNSGSRMVDKKRLCKLCKKNMCPDCRSRHQLSFLLQDCRLAQRNVTVCRNCEAHALSTNAFAIAREEAMQNNLEHHYYQNEKLTSAFNSSVSSQDLGSSRVYSF